MALLYRREDYDDRKLCLFGLSYLDHLGVNLLGFELSVDIESKLSFRTGSSSGENHRVFEEGGEFGLALVTSEGGSHADDLVFVEEKDCRDESSVNELNLVSEEERVNLIDKENCSCGNLASEKITISTVMNCTVHLKELISNLAGPWRIFPLLNGCQNFTGNHHSHFLIVEFVEIARHQSKH
jgi:hypothetical protein